MGSGARTLATGAVPPPQRRRRAEGTRAALRPFRPSAILPAVRERHGALRSGLLSQPIDRGTTRLVSLCSCRRTIAPPSVGSASGGHSEDRDQTAMGTRLY